MIFPKPQMWGRMKAEFGNGAGEVDPASYEIRVHIPSTEELKQQHPGVFRSAEELAKSVREAKERELIRLMNDGFGGQ